MEAKGRSTDFSLGSDAIVIATEADFSRVQGREHDGLLHGLLCSGG